MVVSSKLINWAKRNRGNWLIYKCIKFVEPILGKWGGVKITGKNYGHIRRNVRGKSNIIVIGEGAFLNNPVVGIKGNNNKIVFGKDVKIDGAKCSFMMEGDNIEIQIGDGTTFSHTCHFCIQEDNMSVTIGKDCMFANRIIVRTSDSHGIYNLDGNERINLPKPVTIGNHVWIAPNTLILKGVTIGDGSIIGSNSVVTKNIPDNCLAVGQPARIVKENIKWTRER